MLTPAGSVKHRLPSGQSGFENLALAGDWTRNGIDGGCVEAAVISGIEAAESITGVVARRSRPRPGLAAPALARAAALRRVRRARDDAAAVLEQGGKMRGFVLEGDGERIADLVKRMFNVPAGGSTEYRSLGSNVLLLLGGFERVSCLTPPFDRWGSVAEIMASFWIPVMAGRDLGPDLPRRAAGARRPLHLRRQPDVVPGRARDLRLREDDGAVRPQGRRRRARDDGGVRRQLRAKRGGRLAPLPRGRGGRARQRLAGAATRGSGRAWCAGSSATCPP